jgi:hypothetical protein
VKKVLIVTPSFPPANSPDLQRVRMSLPYYRANGWDPVVLAVGADWLEGTREPELSLTIPADVTVHFARAFPSKWTRLLGIHNLGLRAWVFLFLKGGSLLRREKFDLVFISNTQFVTFTLGRIWRFLYRVPYVLDLQDPWRTDYYQRPGSRRPPGGWKYQLARFMAWLLEGWSFRRMSGLMSVSAGYLHDLRARYRWFAKIPAEVIRFGASENDLAQARRSEWVAPLRKRPDVLRFVYTGAAGPIMPHSLTVLFEGLKKYGDLHPERAARLHFAFVGTSYVPRDRAVPSVMPVARACGVAVQIEEVPYRIGHLEALRVQADADVLLMLGSSDRAYSPSKLYPYFLARRPMLSLVFRDSTLERMLEELNCSRVVRFSEDRPKDDAHAELARFFDDALAGFPPGSLPEPHEEIFRSHYLAQELTRHQCALFGRALSHSADHATR